MNKQEQEEKERINLYKKYSEDSTITYKYLAELIIREISVVSQLNLFLNNKNELKRVIYIMSSNLYKEFFNSDFDKRFLYIFCDVFNKKIIFHWDGHGNSSNYKFTSDHLAEKFYNYCKLYAISNKIEHFYQKEITKAIIKFRINLKKYLKNLRNQKPAG